MKKFLATLMTLVCVIGCMFALASCGDEQAESIALNKTELTLEVGAEETLTATVSPETAVDKTVTWTSSAPEVASVDGGKVTAKAAGSAMITAKTSNEKSATCTVTVKFALTEQTDFASLKSDKVTKSEWETAFSENSLVNCTIKLEGKVMDSFIMMKRQTENTDKYLFVTQGEDFGIYYCLENGQGYSYESNADSYIRSICEKNVIESILTYKIFLPCFADFYELFQYNEQNNTYEYNSDDPIADPDSKSVIGIDGYMNIALKIIDGKIAYISSHRGDFKFFVYDYGKTKVTLPTDFTEAE